MTDNTLKHEQQYEELDSLSDWALDNESQDIRNRTLVTPAGEKIGVVQDLLVDRGQERVTAIRLEDGRCCGVERLEIEDDAVIYHAKGTGVAAGTAAGRHGDSKHAEQRIPVVEEQVAIGKRAVEGGSIRVTTRVVSDDVNKDVKLRDETVDVNRRAVGKNLTGAEAAALMKDGTVEVTEHDEEALVSKQAVLKEEVVVSKDTDVRTERVSETAKRTEVDVDRSTGKNRR